MEMDNLNDYYDVKLKESRLGWLKENAAFHFILGNIADKEIVHRVFSDCCDIVVNLAAQAGVRYSIVILILI